MFFSEIRRIVTNVCRIFAVKHVGISPQSAQIVNRRLILHDIQSHGLHVVRHIMLTRAQRTLSEIF